MNKNFNFQSGRSPLLVLVISSLFLFAVLLLVNFNKLSATPKSPVSKKPIPSASTTVTPPTQSFTDESSAPQDGLDCLEESESGCDDSEDVPIDPEDLAGPD